MALALARWRAWCSRQCAGGASIDLYIAASEIYIDGTIEGDLIAAGSTIVINGTVTGNALLAGASIQLNGRVDGYMRAAGAEIAGAGTIGEDLIAGGATLLSVVVGESHAFVGDTFNVRRAVAHLAAARVQSAELAAVTSLSKFKRTVS